VITDIDGTLTDERRRLSTIAIETIRTLQEHGIEVVLSSGNTSCLLKGLSKLIGTGGTFIGENGGVYRVGFDGSLQMMGERQIALDALDLLKEHFLKQGITLDLYSHQERYTDIAFAREVPVDEVRAVLAGWPVDIMDTSFAIHIHQAGIDKGKTFKKVASLLEIGTDEFLAVGDSHNDVGMIETAGTGCCVANAEENLRNISDYCSQVPYGEGFVEIMKTYFPHILAR